MRETRVGVMPAEALKMRRRLFGALSAALDVDFVPYGPSGPSVSALLCFGQEMVDAGIPTMVLGEGRGERTDAGPVRLARSETLDANLRGWVIRENEVSGLRCLNEVVRAETLADVADRPVWTTHRRNGVRVDHAALEPAELGAAEVLRSHLVPGRFLGLLPLLQFIRSVDRENQWRAPPTCASFLLDDPNLHSVRYGYVDYQRLADQATRAGFHVSVATIPFDAWLVRSGAADIFRAHRAQLSLTMHGNNHTRRELSDGRGEQARVAMIAQGLRRVAVLEARTGVPVARVMTAPHGTCSKEAAIDMARLGIESLCITRPFPWLERPPPSMPLAGWFPADASTQMPVMERVHVTEKPDELPLRAFLGQPIVLYGHHWDLTDRPDLFDVWHEHVARLGDVQWSSVGRISRSMVSRRAIGETLYARPHTRVVEVEVPFEARRFVVEPPEREGYEQVEMSTTVRGTREFDLGGQQETARRGLGVHTVRMLPESSIDPRQVPNPAWSAWPVMRRFLSEIRDRSRPFMDAARNRRLSGAKGAAKSP